MARAPKSNEPKSTPPASGWRSNAEDHGGLSGADTDRTEGHLSDQELQRIDEIVGRPHGGAAADVRPALSGGLLMRLTSPTTPKP